MKFKVSELITLKLENGKTNIYIDGEYFYQCKNLLLNIPIENISVFDDIESIDEAAERLDRSLEEGSRKEIQIPPEIEFLYYQDEDIAQFEKETGKNASIMGRETKKFMTWLSKKN